MSIIKRYHSQNKAERTFGSKFEPYFLGIELEVQAPYYDEDEQNADALKVRQSFHANKFAYFERDCTVSPGFEIITAPMRPGYFRYHRSYFDEALNYLAAKGYRSHDASCSCGIHVHVSVEAFGELESERDYNETKLALIVEKFWTDVARLARRGDCSWSRHLGIDLDPANVEQTIKSEKRYGTNHGRALNFGNHDTVEFRIFRGTLKPETFAASVELVMALVASAVNLKLKTINEATSLRDVLTRGAKGRLNADLNEYMVSKGL